jgi:hypothetical protein
LRDFSFCNQVAGDPDGGRFSARMTDIITVETFPAYERLILNVEMADDSAPLSAKARIVSERDFMQLMGEPFAPADYVLLVEFPNWLHDEVFDPSIVKQSHLFTRTEVLRSATFHVDQDEAAGVTLVVAIEKPHIYHLSLSHDEDQIRIAVSREPTLTRTSDRLTLATGGDNATLPERLFFLYDGDIWRMDAGEAEASRLTHTPEDETTLAVSSDGQTIAFCRSQQPGVSLTESSFAIPSSLWLMQPDGSQPRHVADTGVNCAELSFSPDSAHLAMSMDETGIAPEQRSIKVIPISSLTSADPTIPLTMSVQATGPISGQIVASSNEWSRYGPQWLDATRLVYAAHAPDTRSTLFLLDLTTGLEHDIGSAIQVVNGNYRYRELRAPLVSPGGHAIAVEAIRASEPGADLLLLDANGIEQDRIDAAYWTRALAWGDDGSLFYMTTDCKGTLVQRYELYHRSSRGRDSLVAAGVMQGTIGDVLAMGDNGLLYVVASRAQPGPRGPNTASPYSPAALWYWDFGRDTRSEIFSAQRSISELAAP